MNIKTAKETVIFFILFAVFILYGQTEIDSLSPESDSSFAIEANFDTLYLSYLLNNIYDISPRIESKRLQKEASYLNWISKRRKLYPQISVGGSLPTLSYDETEIYYSGDRDPEFQWTEKLGYVGWLRIIQPTFWGGRVAIVPNVSSMEEDYRLYNSRSLKIQEILFQLRQPILPSAGDHFTEEIARVDNQLKDSELQIEKANAALDVSQIYIKLYQAEDKYYRALKLAELARALIEDAEAREKEGIVRTDWMYTATSKAMRAIADSINAEKEIRYRRDQLTNQLDMTADSIFHASDPDIPPIGLADEDIIKLFVQNSPDILKKFAHMNKQKLALREIEMNNRPQITLTANYALGGRGESWVESNTDFGDSRWSILLGMDISVLDFGARSIELESYKREIKYTENELDITRRTMLAEARIQVDKLRTSRARFDIYRESAIRAEKSLDIAWNQFQNGEKEIESYYDAYNNYKVALDILLDTKAEYYQTLVRLKILCKIPVNY